MRGYQCQVPCWGVKKVAFVPWPICLPHNSGSPGQVLLTASYTFPPDCHAHPGMAQCHRATPSTALPGFQQL